MSIIYSRPGDSYVGLTDGSSWTTARGNVSSSGSIYNSAVADHEFAVYNIYSGGRGGNTYYCRRSYFPFDVSGESGTLQSATISLYLDNLGTAGEQVTLVEATALAGTSADYGNCFQGVGTSTTLGTQVVTRIAPSATAGYHDFTLNSDGLDAIRDKLGSGDFTVCLMGSQYDYSNSAPPLGGDYVKIQCFYADNTGTSKDPKLLLTYEKGTAGFFGCNF